MLGFNYRLFNSSNLKLFIIKKTLFLLLKRRQMKTFASVALAALLAIDTHAIQLGETQIVKIIPDEYDTIDFGLDNYGVQSTEVDVSDSTEIVAAALPLIKCVLDNEDEETVKEIVGCILDHECSSGDCDKEEDDVKEKESKDDSDDSEDDSEDSESDKDESEDDTTDSESEDSDNSDDEEK